MNFLSCPPTFILILLFAAKSLVAAPVSIPQIDKSVSRFMDKYEIPGLSLAITRNGRLVYAKGYGFADLETREKITAESRFRIASLSKPITAAAIFKLIEEGKLTLDTKVFGPSGLLGPKYGMANPNHPVVNVSILHLLQHTSGGWPNTGGDPMFSNISLDGNSLLVWTLRNRALDNTPGSSYQYSNFGYFILGRVIEEVTGKPYEEYVKSEIFLPIGITSMEIGRSTLEERKPGEVKYYPSNRHDPYQYNIPRMDSHGGWIGTSTDLAKFLLHIDGFNTKRNILRHSTIRKMTEPSSANPNYASGWSVNEHGNWWHIGLLPGTRALMVRSSAEFNWAILMNKRGPDGNEIEEGMDQIVWNAINDPSTRWPNADLFP